MKKDFWKIGVSSFLLVALLVTVFVTFATDNAARSGTRSDPLVSRSYIDALRPSLIQEITNELRGARDGFIGDLDAHYDQLRRRIDNAIADILLEGADIDLRDPEFIDIIVRTVLEQIDTAPGGGGNAVLFQRVDLRAGQTLRGQIGTEVILRLGNATGVNTVSAGNPAMVSLTSAQNLNDGAALVANHLYFVTIVNNGLRAGSNGATVFVRGPFEVVG